MRVLQLIDSLRSGGAEQMSVSYANALAKQIDGSYLCCTRQEGLLNKKLSGEVEYLFLNKKHALDLQALGKLRKFVKENRIDLIQAHGTSWFLAVLLKITVPGLKLVWHDHFGKDLQQRKAGLLKSASSFFDGIISVNEHLKTWAENKLGVKKVKYFRNFLPERSPVSTSTPYPPVGGKGDEFRIICLANLRPQKDHLNLLRAFELVSKEHLQISLHLVGKDARDNYSAEIKAFIKNNALDEKVFCYGEQENVEKFLSEADLGVLSSASEGLPLALLEYGKAGLPVVATKVGEISEVVGAYGKLVPPGDPGALASAMKFYLQNEQKRSSDAKKFREAVLNYFSEEAVLPGVLNFFYELLQRNVKQEKVL